MVQIKKVAISGAAGYLGSQVLRSLIDNGSFEVTVLRRPTSTSTFPDSVRVINVDHESVPDLTEALKGQDALILTPSSAAILSQLPLIEAAAAAGVYRLIPSDFGSDIANENVRKLPFFANTKVVVESSVKEKAKSGKLTYTQIHNGAFIPYVLSGFLIDFNNPTVFDGGNSVFSATTVETVAKAVVAVLSKPAETENKTLYINDFKLTQNKLLEIAKQVAPKRSFEPKAAKLADLRAEANDKKARGVNDFSVVVPEILSSLLDPAYGADFKNVSNELLGLQPKGEDTVAGFVKEILEK
ncbi:NAD(P)-binding protein [Sarocladium strictum]